MRLVLSKRQISVLARVLEENPTLESVTLLIDNSSGYGNEIIIEFGDDTADITEFN